MGVRHRCATLPGVPDPGVGHMPQPQSPPRTAPHRTALHLAPRVAVRPFADHKRVVNGLETRPCLEWVITFPSERRRYGHC